MNLINQLPSCRFYLEKYPKVGDYVMVYIKKIQDVGAYVTLLEYDNIEGIIPFVEFTNKRLRSPSKVIRIGREEAMVVIRVDKERGYVDLSKRRVTASLITFCEVRYSRSKIVNSILKNTSFNTSFDMETLSLKTSWLLAPNYNNDPYAAFKDLSQDRSKLDQFDIPDLVKECLFSHIKERLKTKPYKIRADIKLVCFTLEGVNSIIKALKAGESINSDLKIFLIAAPIYIINYIHEKKDIGISVVNEAIQKIKETIESLDGIFEIQKEAHPIQDYDDENTRKFFQQEAERLELEEGETEISLIEEEEEETSGLSNLSEEEK